MSEQKANDIHDVKPSSLSHLIGNDHVRQQVQVALDCCFEDQVRFPDTLLCGPPGLGKSTWASVISKELCVELHETLGQAISGPSEMNVLLLSAKDNELIHIDEVHELPTEQQTTLFLALDQRKLIVQSGNGQTTIPLAKFSFLLSTTDPHRILQPLRDRMRLILDMEYLTEQELDRGRSSPKSGVRLDLRRCRLAGNCMSRTWDTANGFEDFDGGSASGS